MFLQVALCLICLMPIQTTIVSTITILIVGLFYKPLLGALAIRVIIHLIMKSK